jgi:hypothetical protein
MIPKLFFNISNYLLFFAFQLFPILVRFEVCFVFYLKLNCKQLCRINVFDFLFHQFLYVSEVIVVN